MLKTLKESQQVPLQIPSNVKAIEKDVQTKEVEPILDSDKVYWDYNEKIFGHASGMCYDPQVNAYYTLINPKEGDMRPLYQRSKGDSMLAVRGKLCQSKKFVLEDKNWNKKEIYTSKSPKYKPGLLNLFQGKV